MERVAERTSSPAWAQHMETAVHNMDGVGVRRVIVEQPATQRSAPALARPSHHLPSALLRQGPLQHLLRHLLKKCRQMLHAVARLETPVSEAHSANVVALQATVVAPLPTVALAVNQTLDSAAATMVLPAQAPQRQAAQQKYPLRLPHLLAPLPSASMERTCLTR